VHLVGFTIVIVFGFRQFTEKFVPQRMLIISNAWIYRSDHWCRLFNNILESSSV